MEIDALSVLAEDGLTSGKDIGEQFIGHIPIFGFCLSFKPVDLVHIWKSAYLSPLPERERRRTGKLTVRLVISSVETDSVGPHPF